MDEVPQPKPLDTLSEYEKSLLAQGFDNEWIKFFSEIAKNKSLDDIVKYIGAVFWTDRQKRTIMAYARTVLGDGLSTTFISTHTDYLRLYDDKAMIDCDLTLGMTTFDLTPEFNILIGLINLHFGIESRKSRGAMLLKRFGSQRHEFVQEENNRNKNNGFKDTIKEKLNW